MSNACNTCWHCQPGNWRKGFCRRWDIAVEYESGCDCWKEASERRKKQIADMRNMLKNAGFVEMTVDEYFKWKDGKKRKEVSDE